MEKLRQYATIPGQGNFDKLKSFLLADILAKKEELGDLCKD